MYVCLIEFSNDSITHFYEHTEYLVDQYANCTVYIAYFHVPCLIAGGATLLWPISKSAWNVWLISTPTTPLKAGNISTARTLWGRTSRTTEASKPPLELINNGNKTSRVWLKENRLCLESISPIIKCSSSDSRRLKKIRRQIVWL